MEIRKQRALAVFFSILLVTATLTPATAALDPSDADESASDGIDQVRDAIESATQVWRSSNSNTPTWMYYITKIEDKGWTIIKVDPQGLNPLAEWVFRTILASDLADGFFDSKHDALDNLVDRHDNPERIDNDPNEC